MKKRSAIFYVLLSVFIIFAGSFLWSVYTVRGTSFVLKSITRILPETFEIKKITGRLGYSLRLEGVRYRSPVTEVSIDTANLEWQPLYLATGKLSIKNLEIRGVSITDKEPRRDIPYDLSIPKAPLWLTMMRAGIKRLAIDKLSYMAPGSEPFRIDDLSASVLWQESTLYLGELKANTPYGTPKGALAVSLAGPALCANLSIAVPEATAGIDNISIDARLPASTGEEQVAGPVNIRAASGTNERFSLECKIAVTRHAVRVSQAKFRGKGMKGGIEVDGVLDLSKTKPAFSLSAKIAGLDLAPEIAADTDLSGSLDIAGTLEGYRGRFDLKNSGQGWKEIVLAGNINGNGDGVGLTDLRGSLLDGNVLGDVQAFWTSGITLSAHLKGKGLNPGKMRHGLQGSLNVELKGGLKASGSQPMEGALSAMLLDSNFQNRAISGKLDATLHDKTIKINALTAKGSGFAVRAEGVVQQHLSYEIRIDDASKLLPGTAGSLFAKGWARWRDNEPAGTLLARGKNISYDSAGISSFNASIQMPDGYKGAISSDVKGHNVSYGSVRAEMVMLNVAGKVKDHRASLAIVSNKDRVDALVKGKYADGVWHGVILEVSGKEALFGKWGLVNPSTVSVSNKRIAISPLFLSGKDGERIDASADIAFGPTIGFINAKWQNINLARAGSFAGAAKPEGRTSGTLSVRWPTKGRPVLSGEIDASGGISRGQMKLKVKGLKGKLKWDGSGLLAACDIDLAGTGKINASMSSRQPAAFSLPGRGTLRVNWTVIDIGMIGPMLPDNIRVKGLLSGEAMGNLQPGGRFDLLGKTGISGGSFSWLGGDGEITALMKEASVKWAWNDASLQGDANLLLAQYGRVSTSFRFPLPARLPVKIDQNGRIMVSTKGELREKGLLSALFPGLVQETCGRVDFDLTVGRILTDPQLDGKLKLGGAGAYLPSAGIHIKDLSAEVIFQDNLMTVTSFRAASGAGYVGGTASAQLRGRRITNFGATLKGERFQVVNLPELQASVSPDLSVKGGEKNISVNGSILIPEAMVRQEQKENLVRPSPDVVITGKKKESGHALSLPIDAVVTVTLGDRVMVRSYGIDTGLTGKVSIVMKDIRDIRANGAVSTVNGRYNAYGVKLDIKKGKILFGGGPVDQANLDILAFRKVGDISAGVQVTGTPSSPIVNLYSDPAMPDMDILSYIVLGRPRGGGQSDTALLARAAGALLTSGRSSALKGRLMSQLGLDAIDVESSEGTLSGSIVRVGKYLSPQLYISYGRSIFTGENIFGLRYSFSKKWDIESTMGDKSSATLYYKVLFD